MQALLHHHKMSREKKLICILHSYVIILNFLLIAIHCQFSLINISVDGLKPYYEVFEMRYDNKLKLFNCWIILVFICK